MIPPAEFIPLAEDTGLIVEMGELALKQACRDAMSWPHDITVAVNLSALQVETGDIYGTVCDALAHSGLAPARLELEITETLLMRDQERARHVLRKLHRLGVQIALDDFGTCFSNFSNLRDLPFSSLKIDRSFVQEAVAKPESLAILTAVADLAARLGMRSVAEGVETAAALSAVRAAGYHKAQGFYFSLPVPARVVVHTLAKCQSRISAMLASQAA
jgi:EAL domain-containing protein (putative c-di-GMP-specific phosphodiesterase class I)